METNQAIQILVNVALMAQAKGILSLEDAVVVKQAVDTFRPPTKKVEKVSEPEVVEEQMDEMPMPEKSKK